MPMEESKNNSIKEKIKFILSDSFEVSMKDLNNEALPFDSLGIDSLDVADLINTLEKETGKKYNFESFIEVKTVGDLYSTVETLSK